VVDGVLLPVGELAADLPLARVEFRAGDLAVGDVLADVRVADLRRALPGRDQRLARQVDEQHDDEQGEECAAEEAVHETSIGRVPGCMSATNRPVWAVCSRLTATKGLRAGRRR